MSSAIGKTFDSFLRVQGGNGFASLQEGIRQELRVALSPFLSIQGKEKREEGVLLHCLLDSEGFKRSLERRGYTPEPLRLTIKVGKNGTSLEKEELQGRLNFLLKKGSRYYVNGMFHATAEALSAEFEAMELKLVGQEANRIAIGSVQRSADGSYLFTVDVM